MLKGYIYIITNKKNGTLYIGVTRDIRRRLQEHKERKIPGFTSKYGLDVLVYLECYDTLYDAIVREKRLKNWKREWKIKLIEENNPEWNDLSDTIGFVLL